MFQCQHSLCHLLQQGALTCLLASTACALCPAGQGDALTGPCRHLTDAHDHAGHGDHGEHSDHGDHDKHGDHSDHTHLTEEVPADDLSGMVQELYNDSDSDMDLMGWMLQAFGEGCADMSGAAGSAEGGHEGHDHRRRLMSAESHEDDDHGDEDHSGHGGEGETVLDALALREELQSGSRAGRIEEALMYIAACTINGRCTVEAPGQEEEEEGSEDLLGLKFGLAAAIFGMTVVTSYLPALFMRSRHYEARPRGILCCLNAFSGSVFLTVGLTHMLPDTIRAQDASYPDLDYPLATALVVMGFLMILFVEQVVFKVHGRNTATDDEEETGPGKSGVRKGLLDKTLTVGQKFRQPLLTELALVVHAILAAIVLGLAGNRSRLMTFFAAIVSHKVPAAMSIATRFLYRGVGLFQMFVLLLPFHVLPPIAIMIATGVGSESDAASLILGGLATGTFLYIGAFEVVAEEFGGNSCGHGSGDSNDSGSCKGHTSTHNAHGAPDDGEFRNDQDAVGVVSGDSKESGGRGGWCPGPYVKFVFYCAGVALLLGVTVALSAHEH